MAYVLRQSVFSRYVSENGNQTEREKNGTRGPKDRETERTQRFGIPTGADTDNKLN